jgi:subtilisin family serine protease
MTRQEGDKVEGGVSGQRPAAARGRSQHPARTQKPAAEPQENQRSQAGQSSIPAGYGWQAVRPRPDRYLVAAATPADADALTAQLSGDPEIRVVRTIGRDRLAGGGSHIAVIEATPERAAELAFRLNLHVEADQLLMSGLAPTTEPGDASAAPIGDRQAIVVQVLDDSGRPLADAAVCLLGGHLPAAGFTGSDGRLELAVPVADVASATALLVRPRGDCWPVRVNRPMLTAEEPAVVVCERISARYPRFPERALDAWGARAMGFDRLPPTHRGHGVRIALLGSGAAVEHPDLVGRVTAGCDVTSEDEKNWQHDEIGTGTHQAVLIAGHDDGAGVVGLAPEAEVHVCKVMPGGGCAGLIEALDYCIEQQIDVALISCGVSEPSRLLAAKAEEARRRGVACVAAAGDAAGPLGYPAALPGVLAVGAIGRLGTFPPGSAHLTQLAGLPTEEGLFAARLTSTGPGVDCCAPGVAVISGLPPTTYGPADGTASAAAHVAALAGLVLAHHPQFRPSPERAPIARGADRVGWLFQVILASCRPLPQLGPFSTGAGLPDAAIAVGVAPSGTYAPLGVPFTAPSGSPGQSIHGEQAAGLATLQIAMRSAGLIDASDRPGG